MILMADDNKEVRRLIRSLIEDLDSEILECENGQEAMELYEEHEPDLVLMDINMDPVDGITATRRILERFPNARIVIVTEHQERAIRRLSEASGARGFIGKDDLTLLPALVKRLITNA